MSTDAKILSRFVSLKGNNSISTFYNVLGEAWGNLGARLLLTYAESYKRDPAAMISSFIKYDSIKYGALCALQNARRQGFLQELEGQKDFTDYANRQNLEEKWKPVLAKFLLLIWGVMK